MYHVIIPARYASTRLPGKPLQDIAGKTMIEHVWKQAGKSGAESVTVATDDQRIALAQHAGDVRPDFGMDADVRVDLPIRVPGTACRRAERRNRQAGAPFSLDRNLGGRSEYG